MLVVTHDGAYCRRTPPISAMLDLVCVDHGVASVVEQG